MYQVLVCVGANNSPIVFCKKYEGTTPTGKILPEKYNSLSGAERKAWANPADDPGFKIFFRYIQ